VTDALPSKRALALAAAALAGLAGCWLPLGTAQPQSASTVGQGGIGATLYGEFPTVDLIATQDESSDLPPDHYGLSPLPTASLQVAYGIDDDLDLEVSLDGTLYIIVPIPYGASAGVRYQLLWTPEIAVAVAGRIGHIGLGVSSEGESRSMSASYASLGLAAHAYLVGPLRMGGSVTVIPTLVRDEVTEDETRNFGAVAASATFTPSLVLGPVEVGPFFNLAYLDSPNLRGSTMFGTVGVMMALRGQKRPPELPPIGP
jgi:hypothetical protein